MDMEELKNQANELINGNINSYPALSREAAGKAILMLIEKVEKLEEQLRLTQIDNNLLMTENSCYREALERIENECSRHDTTAWSIASDALEALKENND